MLASLSFFSACDILGSGPCLRGKGNNATERRDLTTFTGIDIRLPGMVFVTTGPQHEVKVKTFANLHPEIITEVVGNTLVIRSESCLEYFNDEATFYISIPELENVELKSSAEISLQSVYSSKKLRLILSGSGAIKYTGSTPEVNILHSGSGDIVLVGEAKTLETTLSGSGRVQGFSLAAESAKIILAGSGYQQVWAKDNLDATITGSGNIYYRGTPTITKYTPSSGKLIDSN